MPINKNALRRFRVIDRLLSDPNHDYTTAQILRAVNQECDHVDLRTVQKDILAIAEEFGKEIVRNEGGRGTVRYKDQSQPIFYQELTSDEEEILREVLKTIGQFDGLDNFSTLELMKKKLDVRKDPSEQPIIVFSDNQILQMPPTLLGRLFTAISRKRIIEIAYTTFGGKTKKHVVYPYQLRQYNDRWFLLATPLASDEFPYDPEFVVNFALDRIGEKFAYVDDRGAYVEPAINFNDRFDRGAAAVQRRAVPLQRDRASHVPCRYRPGRHHFRREVAIRGLRADQVDPYHPDRDRRRRCRPLSYAVPFPFRLRLFQHRVPPQL